MKKGVRITSIVLFCCCLLFFALYITFRIVIVACSLEFKDGGYDFFFIELFGIPMALLASISGIALLKEKAAKSIWSITVVISSITVFVMLFFSEIFNLCRTDYNELYINKKDTSIKIVESSFGCGAFDSTPPSKHIVKIQEYPFGLISVDKVDTNRINKADWEILN